MGAFADHSIKKDEKPLLKDVGMFRCKMLETFNRGRPSDMKDLDQIAEFDHKARSHVADACFGCRNFALERHVSPVDLATIITVKCLTPLACPVDVTALGEMSKRWANARGVINPSMIGAGTISHATIKQPFDPKRWADEYLVTPKHDDRRLSSLTGDFQTKVDDRGFLTGFSKIKPRPDPARDTPLTEAGDTW
jgi:hypothetical protein